MNLTIHGHHLEVTPALRHHVQAKLERITRHFDHVIDANVLLTVDKLMQRAEVTVRLRGISLHTEAVESDMYAAIDVLVDKLDRQVLRHKDRIKDHPRAALKTAQVVEQPYP